MVVKGELSNAQRHTDKVIQWSLENRVQLNTGKCKEMRISFTKSQQEFEPILINGDTLEVVENVKLLGLNISSNLTWNIHINEIVEKASKRLYFMIQLKRAKVVRTDLGLFYSSCRSIMDYAVPVFHYSLSKYLTRELEHVQKRSMSVICPGHGYHEALDIMNLKELASHHDEIYETLFDTIVNGNNHRLYKLLPATYEITYLLKKKGVVSKETLVLRRWGISIQKFGFTNGVDNVNLPPYRDSL